MYKHKRVVQLMITILMLAIPLPVMAGNVPVLNHNFEEGLASNGFPVGWPAAFSAPQFAPEMSLSTAQAFDGKYSLRIEDDSKTKNVGLRSATMPAKAGYTYTAAVQVYNESGNAQVYLEFWDAKGTRIDAVLVGATAKNSWHPATVEHVAPVGAIGVTVLLYSHNANVGVLYFDSVTLSEKAPDAQ